MKLYQLSLYALFLGQILSAQNIDLETIMETPVSIRAIAVEGSKIWYAGTEAQIGFVDYLNPKVNNRVTISDQKLQFRTLATDAQYLYTIPIGSPASFFKIDKTTLEPEIFYKDEAPNAFYDALYLNKNEFYTFSDSENDLKMKWFNFRLDGPDFVLNNLGKEILLEKGEAAFAASNSNIAASENYVWLATGGTASRIFRWDKNLKKIEQFTTPIVQGKTSQGIYSIDFYQNFGVAVGGDYTAPKENINTIATTKDAGKTWSVRASGNNAGYMTCVKIKPKSKGKEMIAVGDLHISYSKDYGKSWKVLSQEKGLYTCAWVDDNVVVLAGKNKIMKGKISKK